MKFGKLPSVDGVDFTLPADPPANAQRLPGREAAEKQLFIGCTGFSMPEWVGKVYPPGAKSRDFLQHYSRQFDTIEFNTTHYRIPSPELIERWKRESAAGFRFCPKVPQSISHSRKLGLGTEAFDHFWEVIGGFEEKLGPCFLQLPPYFGPDRLPLLERFLEAVPAGLKPSVELRHPDWFNSAETADRLFALLAGHGAGTVITDVAGRRDVLHMQITTPIAFVRFVGNGLHPTDYSRIDEWVQRLSEWYEQGLEEAYFFPHEPDNVLAPELSIYLASKLSAIDGLKFRTPKLFNDRQGQLF